MEQPNQIFMTKIQRQSTLRTLSAARTLLVEKGWIQNRSFSPQGYCATGAIAEAGDEESRHHLEVYAFCPVRPFFRAANNIQGMISDWNDAKGRTKSEVIAAFDKAISALEQLAAE